MSVMSRLLILCAENLSLTAKCIYWYPIKCLLLDQHLSSTFVLRMLFVTTCMSVMNRLLTLYAENLVLNNNIDSASISLSLFI